MPIRGRRYVQDMAKGLVTWHEARLAELGEDAVVRLRVERDALYRPGSGS